MVEQFVSSGDARSMDGSGTLYIDPAIHFFSLPSSHAQMSVDICRLCRVRILTLQSARFEFVIESTGRTAECPFIRSRMNCKL